MKKAAWSRGVKDTIIVSSHSACQFEGLDIAASFHTHPNMGDGYMQEPSETDRRAVHDDVILKGEYFTKANLSSQVKLSIE